MKFLMRLLCFFLLLSIVSCGSEGVTVYKKRFPESKSDKSKITYQESKEVKERRAEYIAILSARRDILLNQVDVLKSFGDIDSIDAFENSKYLKTLSEIKTYQAKTVGDLKKHAEPAIVGYIDDVLKETDNLLIELRKAKSK